MIKNLLVKLIEVHSFSSFSLNAYPLSKKKKKRIDKKDLLGSKPNYQ